MKLLLLILVSTGLSSAAPAKDEAALIKQRYVTYLHGHGSREGMTFHNNENRLQRHGPACLPAGYRVTGPTSNKLNHSPRPAD